MTTSIRCLGVSAASAVLTMMIIGCQLQAEPEPEAAFANATELEADAMIELAPLDAFPGRIEDGSPVDQPHVRPARADAEALSPARIESLLARLPPQPADPGDRREVAMRPGSQPPPRTGVTIEGEFPPPEQRQRPPVPEPQGPIKVLRYGPEGEVDSAHQVSISFDRSMIAVSGQGDAIAESLPLRLHPQIDGHWRWLGTRTLLFEPEAPRLPMATEFTVELDASARAVDGAVLAEPLRWQFATPSATLVGSHPSGSGIARDPLIMLRFDQKIDFETLLPLLSLRAGSQRLPALRQASADEIADDAVVAALVAQAEPQHWLVLRPRSSLPTATNVEVLLAAGAPSAEGPRRTQQLQRFSFTTHGPFRITEARCGWRGECSPSDIFSLSLSNPLPDEVDIESLVKVEPTFPGQQIAASQRHIQISGIKPGRRDYTVHLSDRLRDRYDQGLEGERSFRFKVGAAPVALMAPNDGLVTLDPFVSPRLIFHHINLASVRLRIQRVETTDWPAFVHARNQLWRDDKPPALPGRELFTGEWPVQHEPETLVTTELPLGEWLGAGQKGHLVVLLEIGNAAPGASLPTHHRPRSLLWLQATDIGIDTVSDHGQLRAWVSRLHDGSAIADAELSLQPGAGSARSDSDGLARLDLPASPSDRSEPLWLQARLGDDAALLPSSSQAWGHGTWQRRARQDELRWHVFDDRAMYRPGERVHIKGWLRVVEARPDGGLRLPKSSGPIRYSVIDARGNTLHNGTADLSALGGFDLAFDLPDTPNLGHARLQLELRESSTSSGQQHQHGFQIQEFRTPEFEVSASIGDNGGPFFAGQTLAARVDANYYAGGALPGAEVNWLVVATPGHYTPPNRSEWAFGFGSPWWWMSPPSPAGSAQASLSARTGADGGHDLAIVLDRYDQPRPLSVQATANVQDVNRQTWASSATALVHPALAYVGLKTERYFVDRGRPLELELIVVDVDGKAIAEQPVQVQAGRVDWLRRGGRYDERVRDVQDCTVVSDHEGLARCRFDSSVGGQYRITATTVDDQGRRNATRITRWVSGGDAQPGDEQLEIEPVLFVPDQDEYAPGDTARILVQAPFADAEGLLTLGRHGIAEQRRFQIDGHATTLEIPIRNDWIPNVELSVILVGQAPRDGAEAGDGGVPRPAQAGGTLQLRISRAERVLAVEVEPAQMALVPGARTRIDLQVRDAAGKPVSDAELALLVVDEAVLALSDYRLSDPGELFYRLRPADLSLNHLRPTLLLASDLDALEVDDVAVVMLEPPPPAPSAPPVPQAAMLDRVEVSGARLRSDGRSQPAIAVRSDFNPLAAFVPALRTGADGRVSAEVQLPDNLTRYRVMVIAVSGAAHYGIGESNLTARLPLMVRPSPPRFLNFGDRFEFPVLVQNQTDAALEVDVAMTAANLEFSESRGYRVQVPAHDRVELRVPMAAQQAGRARFQLAAASGDWADAAGGALPVWTPSTREAFASYGSIDDGALLQPVTLPEQVWPQIGGLSVTTTSTALASLTDAFLYLHDYPFECTEQLASRVLATVALRDVLQAFEVPGLPGPDAIAERVLADIRMLETRHNPDGGFGLWRRGQESWPYVSLHVSHALLRARDKGYAGNGAVLSAALNHLRAIERHIPRNYGDYARRHIIAYSLYLRALDGDRDPARARTLIAEAEDLDTLSFEAIGWLLAVLSGDPDSADELARLHRFLNNHVSETAAGAQFARSWRDGDHYIMHSDRRADAVILDALIRDQPESDLIGKLVHALQAHRVRGRWGNTQENVFVLLALDRYFQRFEATTPDFVARTWLGETFAGEHAFRGRSSEAHRIDIPMAQLAQTPQPQPLLLAKDGPGRLYYRIGLDYAPRSLTLEPAQYGFEVQRVYVAIDDPDDVRRADDGTWDIRAGARVAVDLRMIAPARRHHVALIDPLPAGLEAINPALAVSDAPRDEPPGIGFPYRHGGRSYRWGRWYEHQNLRSERAEAFASLLPGGVYTYRYYARATTLGEFVVPPARAEEMYEPETFGRSGSDRVRVADR